MTPAEMEVWKESSRLMIHMCDGVLEMLEERRPRNFAHDNTLRPYIEVYRQWHVDLLTAMERDGDAFELPPPPPPSLAAPPP